MSRDETIAALADEIVQGVNYIPLGTVLDAMLDEPLLSNDDAAMMIAGDRERRADILDKAEKAAQSLVVAWLQLEDRGMALVDERLEGERWWQEQHDNDAALGNAA